MLPSLLLVVMLAGVQGPPPPPPPPPNPLTFARDAALEKKGTAIVKGHVKTIDGRPLRRAQVAIRGSELPNGRTASTGLEGEYEFRELPAGRFTVTANRGGYLPASYGQRRHGEQGTPIDIANGAALDRIDLTLERAGVISGRVLDEAGEPVSGAAIWVMQSQFFRGRRQFVPANIGAARTDDMGVYRLSPVAPGEYVVLATFRETWASDDKDKQTLGYAASYYPGTASLGEASRIKVVAGQELAALDFSLVPGRAASVSGTVMSSDGSPLASASVAVVQEMNGPSMGSMSMITQTRAGADGTFRLRDVSPGQYMLRATGSANERGAESAGMNLTVTGADIEGLVLGADMGGVIAGRVMTDTGAPLPTPRPTVTTSSAAFERSTITAPPSEDGKADADGRFQRRAWSGPAFVRIAGLPAGWALKGVTHGGRDVTNTPLDIGPGASLGDITIVVSATLAPLTGQVSGADGRPSDAPVLLVPASDTQWHEAADAVRTARADTSGKFRFDRVRPGEYLIVAVERMTTSQQYDPDFLAPLRERATKITVGNDPATVDLKVIR